MVAANKDLSEKFVSMPFVFSQRHWEYRRVGDISAGILGPVIFKENMGARNRVGKGLSYRPVVWLNLFIGIDSWAP